jgi:DNA-directed RNA polymerase specialized sigma24 family protein
VNDDVAPLLRAVVLLLLDERSSRDDPSREKPEVLLARAGLTAQEIADLLGKKIDAVRKTLQRAGRTDG